MQFDDRLATVLRQRAAGERAARTQFRQLIDLLDQRFDTPLDSVEESGWQRLSDLSAQIPARERATILREGGWRLRNLSLILFLSEQEPDVAASALSIVDLSPQDWVLLILELPIRARGFLRLRRDLPLEAQNLLDRLGVRDRALPAPVPAASEVPDEEPLVGQESEAEPLTERSPAVAKAPTAAAESPNALTPRQPPRAPPKRDDPISALVRRIEAFQATRRGATRNPAETASLQPEERTSAPAQEQVNDTTPITSFAFTTDPLGTINWADAEAAAMIVGASLIDIVRQSDGTGDGKLALRHHLPLRGAEVSLAGARPIEGTWVLDAAPRFAARTGAFEGYHGLLRRPIAIASDASEAMQDQVDRLRQLLHELRTPVNAIQGYAEFIQQELVGRTPYAYRALAASISGDSARILSGFDDLDRLARLESRKLVLAGGPTELHEVVAAAVRQLRPTLQSKGAGFDLLIRAVDTLVPLALADAELLVWRILAAAGASAGAGEVVEINLQTQGSAVVLTCGLAESLSDTPDLFATDFRLDDDLVSSSIFGTGFALRLARAEARGAGGDLRRGDGQLLLSLPLAQGKRVPASPSKIA